MTTPTETPTPLTDANVELNWKYYRMAVVDPDVARKIERQLTAATAQLEEARKVGTEMLERLKLIYGDEIECGSTMERWEKTLAAMQQKEGK